MKDVIKYLTFVPWILYFIEIMLYRIGVIETHKFNKKAYFNHLNSHFFKSINVKEIILFLIFLLFMQRENTMVLEILFVSFYMYLLIDFFLDLAYGCKKIHHKVLMVQSVVLLVAIIGFFAFTRKLYTTYILMFSVSILSSFIIYVFGLCVKKPLK